MTPDLTNPERRRLKAAAQHLEPLLRIGRQGIGPEFLAALDQALTDHELVKVKFVEFKEEKKTLAPQLAERTGSKLIMRVGNVAVLFRRRPPAPSP